MKIFEVAVQRQDPKCEGVLGFDKPNFVKALVHIFNS